MSRRVAIAAAVIAVVVAAAVLVRLATRDDEEKRASECAAAGVERPLPDAFPSSFPLPPGTRVTEAGVSAARSVLVRGAAPLSVPEAAAFLRASLPAAGWGAAGGEREGGGAVSAGFRGHGLRGTWTLDEIPGCPSTSFLTLRFRNA